MSCSLAAFTPLSQPRVQLPQASQLLLVARWSYGLVAATDREVLGSWRGATFVCGGLRVQFAFTRIDRKVPGLQLEVCVNPELLSNQQKAFLISNKAKLLFAF